MASYRSGFDPPTRPEYRYQDTRTGNYLANSIRAQGEKRAERPLEETVKMRVPIHMEPRLEAPKNYGGRPSNLPKPRAGANPSEYMPTGRSNFGFRRPSAARSTDDESEPQQPRNLRKKPSIITQPTQNTPPNNLADPSPPWPLQQSRQHIQPSMQAPEELGYYPEPTIPFLDNSPPIIPELDRYRFGTTAPANLYQRDVSDIPYKLSTQDLPPNPTPLSSGLSGHSQYSVFSGYSASPSTRFTESPAPGPYSRDTTPTSISSQSPGLMVPLRGTPRLRQGSPMDNRPPVTRRRMGSASEENDAVAADGNGLPALRESLTSSSSNSTVKGRGKDEKNDTGKKKKKRLSPLPPSPPPRRSSQKFKETSSADNSPSKVSKSPARPVMNAAPTTNLPNRNVTSPRGIITSPNLGQAAAPPRRPSRDGTPDLRGIRDTVNVVQSNLSGVPVPADRRLSGQGFGGGLTAPSQAGAATRPGTKSRLPRSGAPSPVNQIQREPTPSPAGLGIIPDLHPGPTQTRPGLRTPSPSAPAPKHRFGLFGRRTKTAPGDIPTANKQEKTTRKGPAAGTGHEGYRFGSRGHNTAGSRERRPSNAGSIGSQDSYSSLTAMHDPFLSQRMSPVVISGGGEVKENFNSSLDLSRTESNQSLPLTRPSLESKGSAMSSRTNLSSEAQRATLWPSAMPRNATANNSSVSLASKGTLVSDISDNDSFYPKKSLAVRRSLLRLNKSELQSLNLPAPIKIPAACESGLSSLDTAYVSDGSRADPTRGRKRNGPNKLTKRTTSPAKKWNFFQRTKNAKTEQKVLPVVVSPEEKDIPFYAIMDSSDLDEDKILSAEDIENILREAEAAELLKSGKPSDTPPPKAPVSKPSPAPTEQVAGAKAPNGPEIPQMWKMEERPEQAPARPSRLAQVGRIPRVVQARPDTTSPKSFSRPFARISMIKEPGMLSIVDPNSVANGPSPERSPNRQPHPDSSTPATQQPTDDRQPPFLVISPRKGSETGTSFSSGTGSSFAGTTAVIPKADDALEEDEVWFEYDDLIGQADADRAPLSATSSHGVPFQYEEFETRRVRRYQAKESPAIDAVAVMPPSDETSRAPKLADPRPPSLRTTVKTALGAPSPTTPMSFTEFISGYGDRNSSSAKARRVSSYHSQNELRPASGHSKSASTSDVSRRSNELDAPKLEPVQESPAAQVNLRIGSMTVSKWLTFGHVLFSPARDLLLSPDHTKHHSILVIDGLGNDDWSFYAAETYLETTFYNLSPTPGRNSGKRMSVSAVALPAPPENHRQVQHINLMSKFPFTPSTFTVVVLRFPPAGPESLMKHLIAESKRVLKPSGYLEMSILDLDMMNMGPKTRRAVRKLKIGISTRNPEVNLVSMADTVLRLTGKRGFTDVKSCNVGVPVASVVANTSTDGTPAGSDGGSKKDVSLADLMKDSSTQGDEGITKMVAKVGRWWFSRCYESDALAPGAANGSSIFADEKVIQEAERWETNFKLLVAYAQKPEVPRRRTASV
ncbi:hypothetical protein V496_06019 [Pseudogymnoascus sp. VKM F-4515 (FW-2607)]|nr:hypothetical protein V496_06019 [Pseudogymnoascus sp. VKM F-4515 (FW-2607)]KFY99322.1 hypothetical protein V498_00858 [Pseudogymnoascus sp. VKM F-4517 (FW-2822)]